MEELRLATVESRFADIIWSHEPVPSGELVKLCEAELGWKKPTTYTVLRKLCERGLFQNKDGVVTSLVSKEKFQAVQSKRFIDEAFNHSLPAFLASFMGGRTISAKEADDLKALIDQYRGEE